MHGLCKLILPALALGLSSPAPAQVVPGPGYMVWQQGIKDADGAEWRRLGCPHDYGSDAEKEEMIRRGECRTTQAAPGTPPANAGTTPRPAPPPSPPAGQQRQR